MTILWTQTLTWCCSNLNWWNVKVVKEADSHGKHGDTCLFLQVPHGQCYIFLELCQLLEFSHGIKHSFVIAASYYLWGVCMVLSMLANSMLTLSALSIPSFGSLGVTITHNRAEIIRLIIGGITITHTRAESLRLTHRRSYNNTQ